MKMSSHRKPSSKNIGTREIVFAFYQFFLRKKGELYIKEITKRIAIENE